VRKGSEISPQQLQIALLKTWH